jgi:hypothetical protein
MHTRVLPGVWVGRPEQSRRPCPEERGLRPVLPTLQISSLVVGNCWIRVEQVESLESEAYLVAELEIYKLGHITRREDQDKASGPTKMLCPESCRHDNWVKCL